VGDQTADERDDDRPINPSIPDFSLVVLVGAPGSGKSSFARKWFRPTEIISSDHARALVSDDERDQSVSGDAFVFAPRSSLRPASSRRPDRTGVSRAAAAGRARSSPSPTSRWRSAIGPLVVGRQLWNDRLRHALGAPSRPVKRSGFARTPASGEEQGFRVGFPIDLSVVYCS
jgi:AAA domain